MEITTCGLFSWVSFDKFDKNICGGRYSVYFGQSLGISTRKGPILLFFGRFSLVFLSITLMQASKKLKTSVHENYQKFIDTASEVEHLENDMLELRNHLTEVNSVIKG